MIARKTIVGVVGGALLLTLAACSSGNDEGSTPSTSQDGETTTEPAPPAGDDFTIGMASYTLGGPYFVGMEKAVVAAGEDAGVSVLTSNADGDDQKLLDDINNFVAQGVDGIIISGGPLNDFPAGLAAAEAASIPVVLVDRKFSSENYTAWVGPDNEALGRQDGDYITEALPDGGVAVIIKGGPADNTIGIARTTGVKSALEGAGNFTVEEAPDFGNWSSDGGVTVMENMLAKLATIDVVFCENDAMCLGAQKAASDAGRSGEMFFAAVDGQNEAVQEIIKADSNYKVTGYNDANVIGAQGFDTLLKALKDEDFSKDNVVPSPMITIDNAEQYKDAGIY